MSIVVDIFGDEDDFNEGQHAENDDSNDGTHSDKSQSDSEQDLNLEQKELLCYLKTMIKGITKVWKQPLSSSEQDNNNRNIQQLPVNYDILVTQIVTNNDSFKSKQMFLDFLQDTNNVYKTIFEGHKPNVNELLWTIVAQRPYCLGENIYEFQKEVEEVCTDNPNSAVSLSQQSDVIENDENKGEDEENDDEAVETMPLEFVRLFRPPKKPFWQKPANERQSSSKYRDTFYNEYLKNTPKEFNIKPIINKSIGSYTTRWREMIGNVELECHSSILEMLYVLSCLKSINQYNWWNKAKTGCIEVIDKVFETWPIKKAPILSKDQGKITYNSDCRNQQRDRILINELEFIQSVGNDFLLYISDKNNIND